LQIDHDADMKKGLLLLTAGIGIAILTHAESFTLTGKISGQAAGNNGMEPAADTLSMDTLRAAVEKHPDSLSAHLRFIAAFEKSVPGMSFENRDSVVGLLEPQYIAWMKRFPRSATVPLAIGDAYIDAESPKARAYLLKAVALDPKMAKAWEDLAGDAELWGDVGAEREYWKRAMDAEPGSVDYSFQYAFTFRSSDPEKYRQLSLEVAKNFPNSERGAQAFYWLAQNTKDPRARMSIYEQSRKAFPPELFDWSAGSMSEYFDLLLELDPDQALPLARSMVAAKVGGPGEMEWHKQVILAGQVADARRSLVEHRPAAALRSLDSVKLNRWSGAHEVLKLLKAQTLDALGNTRAAYDTLLFFFAKTPFDRTREGMMRYGAKLGKDKDQVDADVRKLREAADRPAAPFTLAAYLTPDSVSLADYRGKALLLTFWFPGCGPCRDEFRYFQAALNTFDPKDIAFVGININPTQDAYVAPFMRSSGFGFTPLHDNGDRTQKAYHVAAAPTSFLIDRQGRIAFSDIYIRTYKARRMLELMIGSLLEDKP
jgi:peroxiredoxin